MAAELIRALLTSFFGTMGFCAILQVPRQSVLPASCVGSLTYLIYWLLMQWGIGDSYAVFIASVFGSLSAQILARRLRMISTIFVLMAIVPAVPGLGLYRFMAKLGAGEYSGAAATGVDAMITILGISLGVALGSILFRTLLHWRNRLHDKVTAGIPGIKKP